MSDGGEPPLAGCPKSCFCHASVPARPGAVLGLALLALTGGCYQRGVAGRRRGSHCHHRAAPADAQDQTWELLPTQTPLHSTGQGHLDPALPHRFIRPGAAHRHRQVRAHRRWILDCDRHHPGRDQRRGGGIRRLGVCVGSRCRRSAVRLCTASAERSSPAAWRRVLPRWLGRPSCAMPLRHLHRAWRLGDRRGAGLRPGDAGCGDHRQPGGDAIPMSRCRRR